jgi:hypothetical protein
MASKGRRSRDPLAAGRAEISRMARQRMRDQDRARTFGNGESGGDQSSHPIHATDAQGNPVTASFGDDGDTYLADGHVESAEEFWGPRGAKGHDHYGPGDGQNDNGTERGKYTGSGS